MPQPEFIRGNWLAIRKEGEAILVCDACAIEIKSGEIYNEATKGTPWIFCSLCVQHMIEATLDLIRAGK